MKAFPVRRLLTIGIVAICVSLAISNHYTKISQGPKNEFCVGAPPPAAGAFPEAILVTPGTIAALPLILLGSTLESGFFLQGAMILGAAFFWYCVGWVIDCALGLVPRETPPRFVTLHLRVLSVASAVLFPFGLLRGLQVGNHFCANHKPPYWSELLMYGIGMVWISLGASFELLRFFGSRPAEPQGLNLNCVS